jgi:hypothetical protein
LPDNHKVNDMTAFGWVATGHRMLLASLTRRRRPRKPVTRASAPRLETLENIDLMSVSGLAKGAAKPPGSVSAEVVPFTTTQVAVPQSPLATPAQTSTIQTATVPQTLTNFLQPFNPTIDLFNPTVGQLVAVHVTATATLNSQIRSENTSTTSGADITGFTQGNYQILGLNAPIAGAINNNTATVTVAPSTGGPITFQPPSGVTFPPLVTTQTQTFDFTQPSDLAFFTATPARQALTPVLAAAAQSGATAPNGNLVTQVSTFGAGSVTVTYDFIPQSPQVTQLVRFGLHHQPTTLLLSFSGPLNQADASVPANYFVVAPNRHGSFSGPGTRIIPVIRATYNPVTNQVLLLTGERLNVHRQYQLHINLPGFTGQNVIQFGGVRSLGGFVNVHTGAFVPVTNGNIPAQFRNGNSRWLGSRHPVFLPSPVTGVIPPGFANGDLTGPGLT